MDAASLPPRAALRARPGGETGGPVVTSNNPEVFTGNGVLFGTLGASATRGGGLLALGGSAGFYVHHLNRAAATKNVSIVVRNEGA